MMNSKVSKGSWLMTLVLAFVIVMTGCEDDFYLSEHEVRAYESIFVSDSVLASNFDNIQGRAVVLSFNNSTGTPKLQSSSLLYEMRRTDLANLETGDQAVSLARLKTELETQIGKWVENNLELYTTPETNDSSRLTELSTVKVVFLTNPAFTYRPETQSIFYDVRIKLVITGVIEVNAVNWLVDLFTNINGEYPLKVTVPNLRLSGDATVHTPYSNSGRVRFVIVPEILSQVQVAETGTSVPGQVKDGVREIVTESLSKQVREEFLLDYDHFSLPKIRLTNETQSRLKVSYHSKSFESGADSPEPLIHSVSRKSDGKLYHAQKSDGSWGPYSPVPMPTPGSSPGTSGFNDPEMIESGAGQLELAATRQNGELVYANYRDGKWSNGRVIPPVNWGGTTIGFRGKPSLVASAPGQAEIIAEGTDGNLWHIRRINGIWLVPVQIPLQGFPGLSGGFRSPVAVHVGNKFTVVFSDANNRLFGVAYDLETDIWGQPTVFRTSSAAPVVIQYSPTAVASGERRVDVVYAKTGGYMFHRKLDISADNFLPGVAQTGISFDGNEKYTGGQTNATPRLAASTYKQPELIARGLDNKLYHSHFEAAAASYVNDGRVILPGWQGFEKLEGSFAGSLATSDSEVEGFGAAGTSSGSTEVLARGLPKPGYTTDRVYHNSFKSARFGNPFNPWKTVHWKRWDSTGGDPFLGEPAIAVVAQGYRIASVANRPGFGKTVHTGALGQTNISVLHGDVSGVDVQDPVDPIVLSSGTGIFDTIAVANGGQLLHTRYYSDGTSFTYNPGLPDDGAPKKISADAYGNGLIELAVLSSDNHVYHLRFRNSVWSEAAEVTNQIVSAPILVHTGAGQLELLGVDDNNDLYRWRFYNNIWQPRLEVPAAFQIDPYKFYERSASTWGDGTIDLAVVGLQSRKLYHRRIGPGNETCNMPVGCPPPREFANLGGDVLETPVMTAFSPTHMNVLTMQGLRWYSITSEKIPFQPSPPLMDPVVSWSGHTYIGGDEMIIGGVGLSGRNNALAVAVRDGEIFINKRSDGIWRGFKPLIGQTQAQVLAAPVFLSSVVSQGGR